MGARQMPIFCEREVPHDGEEERAFARAWKERFAEFASEHDDDAGIAGWSRTGLATRVRHFLHYWRGTEPGARWLDVGCGAGTYSRILLDSGASVIALDYSWPTLVKARTRLSGHTPLVAADVTRLPFAPGSAAGVLCFGVLQALPGSRGAINELARVVPRGGEVWIDALNSWCLPHLVERLWRWLRGKKPHVRYESPWRVLGDLRRVGLNERKLFWLPILPARLQRHQWLLETRVMRFVLHAFPPLGALVSHSFLARARKA